MNDIRFLFSEKSVQSPQRPEVPKRSDLPRHGNDSMFTTLICQKIGPFLSFTAHHNHLEPIFLHILHLVRQKIFQRERSSSDTDQFRHFAKNISYTRLPKQTVSRASLPFSHPRR